MFFFGQIKTLRSLFIFVNQRGLCRLLLVGLGYEWKISHAAEDCHMAGSLQQILSTDEMSDPCQQTNKHQRWDLPQCLDVGCTLDEYVPSCRDFTLERFFYIANVVTAAVMQLHVAGLVHGVCPLSSLGMWCILNTRLRSIHPPIHPFNINGVRYLGSLSVKNPQIVSKKQCKNNSSPSFHAVLKLCLPIFRVGRHDPSLLFAPCFALLNPFLQTDVEEQF